MRKGALLVCPKNDNNLVKVRAATSADLKALRKLHRAAFGNEAEADLVVALHEQCDALVSILAESEQHVLGHILFSPCRVEPAAAVSLWGLAPMAVMPALQQQGIGGRLIRAGFDCCRERGIEAIVVLGHAAYYPRFGFRPAQRFGLQTIYDVPADAFMAIELVPDALLNVTGVVHYHPLFSSL